MPFDFAEIFPFFPQEMWQISGQAKVPIQESTAIRKGCKHMLNLKHALEAL